MKWNIFIPLSANHMLRTHLFAMTDQEKIQCRPSGSEAANIISSKRPISSDDRIQVNFALPAHNDIIDGIGMLHFWVRYFDYALQVYDKGEIYQFPHSGDE
ncbi:uncharacterized protein EURHEDRAFT_400702 [Aspergillus ruber CBS 135680]|uniref:Uncharacterized protein n=1 Tax=Aspergillus ruber (strain CBS 135680) TaxID=1388766 RepID=A0A017SM46_ASPRC|nr:uncharacterized protein EURHEDRAFT_400702 [Aspergillus ruber CBS 135680]EYE97704.1 hypothetical protein EURHEDRAFT_400702 [Aspergillus ruber CBS 135680]